MCAESIYRHEVSVLWNGDPSIEPDHLCDDDAIEVVVDGRPAVGVIWSDNDGRPVMRVGHWPNGEEWVELLEVTL